MNIRLLGTGAADGIPGFYSSNRVSQVAREIGGADVRTRSAALVDGQLKIDLPPDTFCQLARDGLNAQEWSALLFTHSHEDHFAVGEIQYALYPFTELEELPYSIYGNPTVIGSIRERYPDWPMDLIETRLFECYNHAAYAITPIRANHKIDEECHNLLIQKEGKTLLYATDTGVWSEETFDFLTRYPLDCLVIECTEGYRRTSYLGHLNLEDLGMVLEQCRTLGIVHTDTLVVTTHHAHTGNALHRELQVELAKMGAEPGFDGMVIEF